MEKTAANSGRLSFGASITTIFTMRQQSINRTLTVLLLAVAITTSASLAFPQARTSEPAPAPAKWLPLIGEYVRDSETVIILESDGKLSAFFKGHDLVPLREVSKDSFEFDNTTSRQ